MPTIQIVFYSLLALLAFAGNSLICRAALAETNIDATSFTSIRLISGAIMLAALLVWRQLLQRQRANGQLSSELANEGFTLAGDWTSALALFIYAIGFSFAYVELATGTGALLLYAAVQTSMISFAIYKGERLNRWQLLGISMAVLGLIALMAPSVEAPPVVPALIMLIAGAAWGTYSIRGQGVSSASETTAGNFIRSVPITLLASLIFIDQLNLDQQGVLLAIGSGALTSALGYIIWYKVLPQLPFSMAATMQLSVPVLSAIAGLVILSEPITLSFVIISAAILSGIALFILNKNK